MKREEIIEKIIAQQEQVVATLKQSAQQFETASDLDESEARDIDDLSHQDEAKDMQLRYENLLADAENNLEFLRAEAGKTHGAAEAGTVVDLGDKIIFVGVSVPKFEADGKEIISISEDAPIFAELKDKKPGDTLKMGDETLTVKGIY